MVSMRRHILSRANVVALERQLEISQSPFSAPFLFALRLSQSKVARCSMGSIQAKALPFEPRPPMESGHTPLFAVALGLRASDAWLKNPLVASIGSPVGRSGTRGAEPPSGSLTSRAAGIVERIVDLRRNP